MDFTEDAILQFLTAFLKWAAGVGLWLFGIVLAMVMALSSTKEVKAMAKMGAQYIERGGEKANKSLTQRKENSAGAAFLKQRQQAGTSRRIAQQSARKEMSFRQRMTTVGTGGWRQGGVRGGASRVLGIRARAADQNAAQAAFRNHQASEAAKPLSNLDMLHVQAYSQYGGNEDQAIDHLRANGTIRDAQQEQAFRDTATEIRRRGIDTQSGAAIQAIAKTAADQGNVLLGAADAAGNETHVDYLTHLEGRAADPIRGLAAVQAAHPQAAERSQIAFQARLTAAKQGQKSLRPNKINTLLDSSTGDILPTVQSMINEVDAARLAAAAAAPAARPQAIAAYNSSVNDLVTRFGEARFAIENGRVASGNRRNIETGQEQVAAYLGRVGHPTAANFNTDVDANAATRRRTSTL